jgi:alpha-methylacyl-CoA racemase
MQRSGPLAGVRFVEMAGIGPVPLASMVLADLGAEGIRVENPRPYPGSPDPTRTPLNRGRASVVVNLKAADGPETVLRLLERADVVLEGFRPGVMERLGLGPDTALARNPSLVYGRMTGWGQDGPLAHAAGHDIDYIAIAGALRHFARKDAAPVPPMNLVGDFGGGAMLLLVGVLAALTNVRSGGSGQVVDAAMVDGTALLMAMSYGFYANGMMSIEPGTNILDTGAPYYDVYETADGRHVGVGAIEAQFYAELLRGLGLDATELPAQTDVTQWPKLRATFADVFRSKTLAEWTAVFDGTDACVAPILDMVEAASHPHMQARGTFVEVDGVLQPAAAPRFSATPVRNAPPSSSHGADTEAALAAWGFPAEEVQRLLDAGAVATGPKAG